jgi:iron-regulated transporter 1
MWAFAVPLLLAKMFTSLLPSSLFATISQLCCVIFGGYVGSWIDNSNRLRLQQTALIVQNASVVSSFILLIILEYKFIATSRIDPIWNNFLFLVLFFGSIAFGSIAAVASMISSISISKEWIVIIQKANPYLQLPNVNASFRRIDLACKLLAPLAFALILSFAGLTRSLIIVTAWNAFSLIPESALTHILYAKVPELAIPKNSELIRKKQPNPVLQIISGWQAYFAQPIFRSSFAYVLLYMTVLSPGGVMTAYLEFKDMSELVIAIFTGLGALVGLMATFVTPHLINKLSLRRTGLISLWAQFSILLLCFIPFFFPKMPIILLPIAIAISRFGLWGFDLVEVQLMQTYVPEGERGTVSGVEYSMANLISVGAYAMGVIVPDPKNFVYLVIVSVLFVAVAMIIYTWWYLHPPRAIINIEAVLARGDKIENRHTVDLAPLEVEEKESE